MDKKKKIILGALLLLILIILIIILAASLNKKRGDELGAETFLEENNTEAELEEEFIIPEDIDEIGRDLLLREREVKKIISESEIVAPGANPITKEGEIINTEGDVVMNAVGPSDSLAPTASDPINPNTLSENVIKLEVILGSFSPNEFRVKAGEAISIALTANDEFIHALTFIDPNLSAINLTVSPSETRVITFKAPMTPGEYIFKCPVGGDKVGHVVRGEIGKMIVE